MKTYLRGSDFPYLLYQNVDYWVDESDISLYGHTQFHYIYIYHSITSVIQIMMLVIEFLTNDIVNVECCIGTKIY